MKNASLATFPSNIRSASSRAARAASHVSSLSVVDLEAPLALERVAANRSSGGEIVLTIFNRGGAAFALNLAHNMRSKGLDFYVLIGNDADSCAAVHAVDSSVACVYSTYMKGDERLKRYRVDAEHGLAPFRLWWARFYYMTELVKRGLNVMYVDIDVSFRSSPYPYFHGPLNNHNLFIQRERRALPGLNIGIVYCQRCSEGSGAHFVLSESLRRRDEILNSEQPLRNEEGHIASGPKNVLWDQHIVNDAAETASAGFESKRRSMSLLYKPENRESWMRSQGYRSEAWRTGKLWKPESLRFGGKQTEFAWHALTGPRSNTTDSSLVGPPGWLFGGFSGIIADSIDQGWWSWWNHEPPPVVMGHMVGSINKIAQMKAYGWWSDAADEVDTSDAVPQARLPASRALLVEAAPLDLPTYEEVEQTYPKIARKIAKLAVATNRRPVIPLLECTSQWMGRDRLAWSGLRERCAS